MPKHAYEGRERATSGVLCPTCAHDLRMIDDAASQGYGYCDNCARWTHPQHDRKES